MPGLGKSEGKTPPGKSDKILEKNGAADIVTKVCKFMGLNKPVVIGYDWGAAIALKMAITYQNMFEKVISFHPSFNEEEKDELKKIKVPVLIQWCSEDQFH